MALQNSEILPCLKLKVKNYTKEIRISMARYWIEYISQYNFSDLIIVIIIIIIIIFLLFTLSSIYSTNAGGAEQMPETNNSNWT